MSHLKSLNTSKTLPIKRKVNVFTTRPNPGPARKEDAISLNFLLRDMLQITNTTRETKKVLGEKTILINDIIQKDHKFPVGILDTITLQTTKEQFMIVFSDSGKFMAKKMKTPLQGKMAKITNKTLLQGKKVQLNLHDGTNYLTDKTAYTTGDTVIIEKKKVKKHLKYEKGALAYLVGGKHKGKIGTIENIQEMNNMQQNRITIKAKNETFETLAKYAFVIEKSLEIN